MDYKYVLDAAETLVRYARSVRSEDGSKLGECNLELDVKTINGNVERWVVTVKRDYDDLSSLN